MGVAGDRRDRAGQSSGLGTTERGGIAVLLAGVGGFVDAVGYLTLFHLFVGQMSGNSVAFGVDLGQHDSTGALTRGAPVALFVVGIAIGVAGIEVLRRVGVRRTAAVLLGLEAGLLACYLAVGTRLLAHGIRLGSAGFFVLLAFAVTAMGLQTAALQRVGGQTVHTTYVTGMLTHLAEEGARYAFLRRDRRRTGRPAPDGAERSSRARVLLLGSLWSAYVAGAVLGGWLEPRWHLRALAVPLAAIAAAIVVDAVRPLGRPRPTRRHGDG